MSNLGYVQLVGDDWASRSVGFLVFEGITALVVASCLFFVRSFRWTFRHTEDTVRNFAFILSTISAVVYFVLDLTTEGEDEDDAIVSYHYFIIYIFAELFFRISEFAILLVVARTVNLSAFRDFGSQAVHRRVRLLTFFLFGIVGVVSITTFGLFAGYYGYFAAGLWTGAAGLVPATTAFIVAYGTLYSTASLYIFVVSILAVARQRSKASILVFLVAIALLLRALFYLTHMVVQYYTPNISTANNLDWAANYLYAILTIGIYLGVTADALMGGYRDPMPKSDSVIELAPSPEPYVSL